MSDTSSNNKRIAKNTIALYFRMIIQMLIGLYTSRVVLNCLGVDDYGLYNVIGSVTSMFTFLNATMSNATMRFITYSLGQNDPKRLNEVFCTSMNIHVIIAIITVIFLDSIGLWFLYNKMSIDPMRISTAFWVLQISIVTCVVSIISVPYNACIIAHEKMGAFAVITLFQSFLTLILVITLQYYNGDRLLMYAILLMLVQVIVRAAYGYYCKKHFEETRFRLGWNKELTKEMGQFAGWTMNGTLAWMGYTQGLNLLINVFSNTAVNAARGIAVTVQNTVTSFCDNFQTAVRPQITKSFSVSDYERMHNLVISSSKLSFYLMLLLSLPLFVGIDEILKIWLGIVPDHTANFIRIILLCILVDSLRNPMNISIQATGDIKTFQIFEGSILLLIVPLSYIFLKLGYCVESVFIVQLVIFVITQTARIIIVCPRINLPIKFFFVGVIKPIVLVFILSSLSTAALIWLLPISKDSLFSSLVYMLLAFVITVLSIMWLGLNNKEKAVINIFLNKILQRKQHE